MLLIYSEKVWEIQSAEYKPYQLLRIDFTIKSCAIFSAYKKEYYTQSRRFFRRFTYI